MSQPLTGQVRRLIASGRFKLSALDGLLLMALADMLPRGRSTWRTTWERLAHEMKHSRNRVRQSGWKLKRLGLLGIYRARYEIALELFPIPDGTKSVLSGPIPDGTKSVLSDGTKSVPFDSPPYNPPQARPQNARSRESGGDTSNPSNANGHFPSPFSSGKKPEKPKQDGRLSASERISLEREIKRLDGEIRRIRAIDEDDRKPEDWERLRTFTARADADLVAIGSLPMYVKNRKPEKL